MKIRNLLIEFEQFVKSTNFAKAILIAVAIVTPITLGNLFNFFEYGLAIGIGALLSSPSDVAGSTRHKRIGILLSAAIAIVASIMGGYLPPNLWIQLPILGIAMFVLAYISIYGFRASLIGFSGLFALVLSFAKVSSTLEPYERAIFIGLGGIWYLVLTTILDYVSPKKQTEEFLTQALHLTSDYLNMRSKIFKDPTYRKEGYEKILQLQSELNETHEKLREILIDSRKTSGNSPFQRKRLLILIQLIDISELAMANPVNYEKLDQLLDNHSEQKSAFYELIKATSRRLEYIGDLLNKKSKKRKKFSLEEELNVVRKSIESYYRLNSPKEWNEGHIILKNLYDYQVQQIEKINKIEQILNTENGKLRIIKKDVTTRFLSEQDYDPKLLRENLNFKSPIFKHAIRLAVIVIIGFFIGNLFKLQNPYWILLTIIVIMRPTYGLTKSRSWQRIIGTLIGAIVAVGIVLLIHNLTLFAVLAIISLILAFATIQKNYRTAAAFITLSVVFVYALLKPDVLSVIQFRVLDTAIGAGLAAIGNAILWPTREFTGIKEIISKNLLANKNYLQEIANYYEKKGLRPTSYKLSRKYAFLAAGDLNAAMQRMTQEPSSQQKNLENIYELVVLNHSFLGSLASMSTYIQNHTTTEASTHFKNYTKTIIQKLQVADNLLNEKKSNNPDITIEQDEANSFFEERYKKLKETINQKTDTLDLQEAQLIIDQLSYLSSISEKLIKRIEKIEFD